MRSGNHNHYRTVATVQTVGRVFHSAFREQRRIYAFRHPSLRNSQPAAVCITILRASYSQNASSSLYYIQTVWISISNKHINIVVEFFHLPFASAIFDLNSFGIQKSGSSNRAGCAKTKSLHSTTIDDFSIFQRQFQWTDKIWWLRTLYKYTATGTCFADVAIISNALGIRARKRHFFC